MYFVDDRTQQQKSTHTVIILGTNSFWGHTESGNSYAGWACEPKDARTVERWVRNRSDIKRVRQVAGDYKPSPGSCAYYRIYVVDENHNALRIGSGQT